MRPFDQQSKIVVRESDATGRTAFKRQTNLTRQKMENRSTIFVQNLQNLLKKQSAVNQYFAFGDFGHVFCNTNIED
jgi:hypothetical protein